MTLPSSGPLSFSAINTELGRSSTALITLKDASDGVYATLNRNSTAGYNVWYNSVVNGNNYSTDTFHDYNHAANILFDYEFTNNSSSDVFDISIDFGPGNNVAYVGMVPPFGGQEIQVNIDTTKSGNGWYVYYSNNPDSRGTLVDIYLYDVNTGDALYSLTGANAVDYTGQSIGPTSDYYRHLGLTLTFLDP
jgi:hypothetical protein